jgi:hypothetical protein
MCAIAGAAIAIGWSAAAAAHCDALDGPVIGAARKALEGGDVKLVLLWVQPADEAQIRQAFDKARKVRAGGPEAKELADRYFFETLVRVHRAGEGAGFTGLKPAGHIEPPVAAADKAIATGNLDPLRKLVAARMDRGLQGHFEQVMAKKKYDPADVNAGRAYSSAYVEFVHYAERLHDAAETLAPEAHAAPAHAH